MSKRSGFAAIVIALLLAPQLSAQEIAVPPTLFVPVGTVLTVQVRDFLSSDRNSAGDGFLGMLQQPLVVDGWVLARPGQTVIGQVSSAQRAGRSRGSSELGIELTEILLVDGQQLPVRTQLLHSYGPESRRDDVAAIAAGTGFGALIGAAVGDGKGAAIGAVIGAAASGAGVLSTRGRATEIRPETTLTFRLDTPLTVSTQRSQQAFVAVSPADYSSAPTLRIPARQRVVQPRPVIYPPWIYFGRSHPIRSRVYVVAMPNIIIQSQRHVGVTRYRR